MKVEWKDDLRPMPDNCPLGCEDAAFDPDLIIKQTGKVIGSQRSIFGKWFFLVLCNDGKIREIEAKKIKIIS